MAISDMHQALKTLGQKFDYIFFDSCFMQCIEVAYELQDVARYIIGSPAEIPAPGANYTSLLSCFFETTGFERDIPQTYYNDYVEDESFGVVVSTIDCSMLGQLAEATRSIINDGSTLLSASYDSVFGYFSYDKLRFRTASLPDMFDMNGIMKTVYSAEDYARWKIAFDKAVPYAFATDTWYSSYPVLTQQKNIRVDREQFGGVSMYVPLAKYASNPYFAEKDKAYVEGYYECQWAKDIWR